MNTPLLLILLLAAGCGAKAQKCDTIGQPHPEGTRPGIVGGWYYFDGTKVVDTFWIHCKGKKPRMWIRQEKKRKPIKPAKAKTTSLVEVARTDDSIGYVYGDTTIWYSDSMPIRTGIKTDTVKVWMLVSDVNGECASNCQWPTQVRGWQERREDSTLVYPKQSVLLMYIPPRYEKIWVSTGIYLLRDKETPFTSKVIWQIKQVNW